MSGKMAAPPKRSAVKAIAPPAKQTDNVKQLLADKLATSMLDAADAKKLRIVPADPQELASLELPIKKAMELPYFDAKGQLTGFKRWRYLEDTRSPLKAKTDAKPLRYIQAGNTVSEVYMPPIVDWAHIQKEPSETIAITEGELKSACCTKFSYPCIGLGGVYSFKSTKKKLPLLPIFYDFVWKDRFVMFVYDSDAHTNPMVVKARSELCAELLALGAQPYIVNISAAEDNSKRGLDDLVYQEGPEALELAFSEAEAFAPSVALHQLNTEVAYIKDPGMCIVLDSGLKMRASDFVGHAYANRHFYEELLTPKGEQKMVKKKAALAWLEWPMRLELERIVYKPGGPTITEAAEYNIWSGWGCEPKKGNVKPWSDLLDHLFGNCKEERDWFERWCALPFQQPGAKMYTAAVLWGVNTGTGKSLVGYTLGRIYGKNFTEIGDKELQDDRKEWAIGKQFVMGDDVTGQDQRKYADKLKKMITQQKIRIDQKYVPSYEVIDVINYLFTSNHPDAFFLEDDDRRNFVHEVIAVAMAREWYQDYMKWLDKEGGAAALFHHFLHLDLKGMTAEDRAPNTVARQSMISDGLSDIGRWVRRLRDDPDYVLRIGNVGLKGDLWSSQELLKLYDPEGKHRVTIGGLGKELKRAGLRQVYGGRPIVTPHGQQRLFAVRNSDKWEKADSKALREHYAATRCEQTRSNKF